MIIREATLKDAFAICNISCADLGYDCSCEFVSCGDGGIDENNLNKQNSIVNKVFLEMLEKLD